MPIFSYTHTNFGVYTLIFQSSRVYFKWMWQYCEYSLFNAFVFYITFVNLERPQVVFYFHESEAWVKIKYNLGSREIYKCDVKWQKSWISVLLLFVSLFYASFPFVDPMWLRRRRDIKHKDFARSTIKLKEKSWECTSETICETPLKY